MEDPRVEYKMGRQSIKWGVCEGYFNVSKSCSKGTYVVQKNRYPYNGSVCYGIKTLFTLSLEVC